MKVFMALLQTATATVQWMLVQDSLRFQGELNRKYGPEVMSLARDRRIRTGPRAGLIPFACFTTLMAACWWRAWKEVKRLNATE